MLISANDGRLELDLNRSSAFVGAYACICVYNQTQIIYLDHITTDRLPKTLLHKNTHKTNKEDKMQVSITK